MYKVISIPATLSIFGDDVEDDAIIDFDLRLRPPSDLAYGQVGSDGLITGLRANSPKVPFDYPIDITFDLQKAKMIDGVVGYVVGADIDRIYFDLLSDIQGATVLSVDSHWYCK